MTLNILVIDDDRVDREMVRRHLVRAVPGCHIDEAESGSEALALITAGKYDGMFLDYQLPDMDGVSLLRRIYNSTDDALPAPTIILTGQGNESVMADGLRWGAHDYLIKDSMTGDGLYIALRKAREFFELKRSRRKAEDLLRHGQKMEAVGQLTSGVSHDFNNLLTVVLGNARLLQKRLADLETPLDRKDFQLKTDAIDKAARRGAELIRRLMIFSRQTTLKDDVIDVNTSVRETAELLQRSLGELVKVRCMPGEEIWRVRADQSGLENALINIAVNARDAMPKGGTLTIETANIVVDEGYMHRHPDAKPGHYVMIALSDTGAGMPVELQRRIFEPFFTTKPPGEGTGLGLAMVYGFIQQSGGHIGLYSEAGHGTVFRLYLPTVGADPAAAARPVTGSGETILVVEDDPDVRVVTQTILERLGYTVLAADNGPAALDLLNRETGKVDLIFTDIVMPGGMNGADLVREAQSRYPGLRALYTSGYTENALPGYQLIEGQDLLAKPYRKEMLARKIRDAIDTRTRETA